VNRKRVGNKTPDRFDNPRDGCNTIRNRYSCRRHA
jgi:hypothetical protein